MNMKQAIKSYYRSSRKEGTDVEAKARDWFKTVTLDMPLECYAEAMPILRIEVLKRLNLCMVQSTGTNYCVRLSTEYKKSVLTQLFNSQGHINEDQKAELKKFFDLSSKQFDGWIFVQNSMRGFLNLELIRNF
jgi:hypothetical protein